MRDRARDLGVTRNEALIVGLLIAVAVGIRIAAAIVMKNSPLLGDEPEYHATATLFADGKLWWGLAPLGYPHESLWKAPGYGLWLGTLYALGADTPFRVELVQSVVGGATVLGTWLLARHLFGRGVALAAAAVVTVYPLAWQWGAELYPEALVIPLLTFTLWVFMRRELTLRLALVTGVLLGVNLLLRPTSVFLLAGVAAAFIVAGGFRRGTLLTGLVLVVALVVVSPWTIRNAVVADTFVLLSVQDAAIQGTFNDFSANDKENPYAWRAFTPQTAAILDERPRPGEVELRRRLYDQAFEYIRDNPESVPKAFYWNGLVRFWDVRRPAKAFDEAKFDGRSRNLNIIGLLMYWLLLPLAIVGLVVQRRRREILWPVAALALGASIVFTIAAATRYRAPLEPLIVILACTVAAGPLESLARRLFDRGEPAPAPAAGP